MQSNREHVIIQELFGISQSLLENKKLKDIISSIKTIMSEKLAMPRGMITILNRKSGDIFIEDGYGFSNDEIKRGIYKIGEGITGKVVETGQPYVAADILKEPEFLDRTNARKDINKKGLSFICVPIKIGQTVIGTISADRYHSSERSLNDDVQLLSLVSVMIAHALHLHQLQHEEDVLQQEEKERLHEQMREKWRPTFIIGNSKKMRLVYESILKVARSTTSVLILGESGVGKELVAKAIHYNSDRKNNPFVAFNCAALAENIIESELFGHEKGAFTGATVARTGKFEMACSGSIFLDEVGEISNTVQAKLLRVLQNKELERVGGSKTIKVNVRIIAATNRNLQELMENGEFREDLFYRLNVFPIVVPPLRERKTDIPLLADYFLDKYNKELDKRIRRISTPAIDMLMSYHWPGNVRELENCIERAVLLSDDKVIHGYHLPPTLQTAESSNTRRHSTLDMIVQNVEYELIVEALKNANGNMARAAKELGLTERVMNLRVKKYDIDFKKFRNK